MALHSSNCSARHSDQICQYLGMYSINSQCEYYHKVLYILSELTIQDVVAAPVFVMPPTFCVASFFAWWACSTATASSTCLGKNNSNHWGQPFGWKTINNNNMKVILEVCTFERNDSWDSSICSSSELSISSSMPVIFPARLACMDWISGNRRSPIQNNETAQRRIVNIMNVETLMFRGYRLLPSICFCSCGGAEASMEAVSGSWPWTCTAGWVWRGQITDKDNIIADTWHISTV